MMRKIRLPVLICFFVLSSFSVLNESAISEEEILLIEKLEKSFDYFDIDFTMEEKRIIVNDPTKIVTIIKSKTNNHDWYCMSRCGLEMQDCLAIAETWPRGSDEWVKAFDKCFFDWDKCMEKCLGPGRY